MVAGPRIEPWTFGTRRKIRQRRWISILYSCQIWPSGLRRGSVTARLLTPRIRTSPEARMSVRCECCVLSCRGLCDGSITHLEEFCRLWCVIVCDLETSRIRRHWPALGCCARKKNATRSVPPCYGCQ